MEWSIKNIVGTNCTLIDQPKIVGIIRLSHKIKRNAFTKRKSDKNCFKKCENFRIILVRIKQNKSCQYVGH